MCTRIPRRTYGRFPTLAEVRHYYAREDFLQFLLAVRAQRSVLMIIPTQLHWEPDQAKHEVPRDSLDALRQYILGRIQSAYPEAAEDQRLPYYPSFHQALEWRAEGRQGLDLGVESDLATWREGFHDMLTLVETLRAQGVSFRCKFSGSRSLHVLFPAGKPAFNAALFGECKGHHVNIVRMPYSLNEDTGLVSLPLSWERLQMFRPWQANLWNVTAIDGREWLRIPEVQEHDKAREFCKTTQQSVAKRPFFAATDVIASCKSLILTSGLAAAADGKGVQSDQCRAWTVLTSNGPAEQNVLLQLLKSPDVEARWLASEAYLLNGQAFTRDIVAELFKQGDPYSRAALIDILTKFPQESVAFCLEELKRAEVDNPALYTALAQSDGLADRVLEAASRQAGNSAVFGSRICLVLGAVLGDWKTALAKAEAAAAASPPESWRNRLCTLKLFWQLARREGTTHRHLQRLGELAPENLDLLMLANLASNKRVKRAAVQLLAELGDVRTLALLVQALASRQTMVAALRGLKKLGECAVPALIEAAASDDVRQRRYAVRCLRYMNAPGAHAALVAAARDSDPKVRREALLALRAPAKPEYETLESAVRDETEPENMSTGGPAYAAVESLASYGEEGLRIVRQLAHESRNLLAAAYLAAKGDDAARKIVLEAATGDPASPRRVRSLHLISQLPPDPTYEDALVSCLTTVDRWRRGMVVFALLKLKTDKSFAAVSAFVRSEQDEDRVFGTRELPESDEPRVRELLIEKLYDRNAKVRSIARKAILGWDEKARSYLTAALKKSENVEAQRAIQAMLELLDLRRTIEQSCVVSEELARRVTAAPSEIWEVLLEVAPRLEPEATVTTMVGLLASKKRALSYLAERLLAALGEPGLDVLNRLAPALEEGRQKVIARLLEEIEAQEPVEVEQE